MDFAVPSHRREKMNENEKNKQISQSSERVEKSVEHESDGDTNNSWRARDSPKSLEKRDR